MNLLDQVTVQLVRETCCNCGVVFAMSRELNQTFLDNRDRFFYCPNGHRQHYIGATRAEKAERAAERANQNASFWEGRAKEASERTARALASQRVIKGHMTRLKKRVAAGVCPCCNRSFKDLSRHMAGQHPQYGEVS